MTFVRSNTARPFTVSRVKVGSALAAILCACIGIYALSALTPTMAPTERNVKAAVMAGVALFLATFFVSEFFRKPAQENATAVGVALSPATPEAIDLAALYDWPGYDSANDPYWLAFEEVSRSPLAREIYLWLPNQVGQPRTIPWTFLAMQFGDCYTSQFGVNGPGFTVAFRREFQKVLAIHNTGAEFKDREGLLLSGLAETPAVAVPEESASVSLKHTPIDGREAVETLAFACASESTSLGPNAVAVVSETTSLSLEQEPFEDPEERARECVAACEGISLAQLQKMNAIAHGALSNAYDACDEIYAVHGAALEADASIDGSEAVETLAYIADHMQRAVAWARLDPTSEPAHPMG